MVPFLYFFYGHPDWSGTFVAEAVEVTVAHATSLAIILPTAIAGVAAYARARLVEWRATLPIAAGSLAGAALGALLAPMLPGDALRLGFGIFLIATGVQLLRPQAARPPQPLHTPLLPLVAAGIGVGVFSALLGVGGGLMSIPVLLHVVHLDIRKLAATSLGIVCFAAAAGTLTYALSGAVQGTPPGSAGYIDVATALPLAAGALVAAPLGAKANQRVGRAALRRIFGITFLVLGARLIIVALPLG